MNQEKLSEAIVSGDRESLQNYVDKGGRFVEITLIAPNGYGKKPVELAAIAQVHFQGSAEITKLVVEHSNEQDLSETLLNFSSEDSSINETRALLESGVPVDLSHENRTALQRATGNGNLKMVHLLLTYGADPNKAGEYGTALESAKEQYYEPALQGMMESFIKGVPRRPFDFIDKEAIKQQLISWSNTLDIFALKNTTETFYVLAIDSGELALNSEEKFQTTLQSYQENFPDSYTSDKDIERLRFSPGDFSYHLETQEFKIAEQQTEKADKFDFSYMAPMEQEQRTKQDLLKEGLIRNQSVLLEKLSCSDNFEIIAPGHVY